MGDQGETATPGPRAAGTATARPTVGLAMIVRNESATLPRLAATLVGQIDHWTVVDTGSSDNTVDVARQVFSYAPGDVMEDLWRGFGPSRNVAFEAAEAHTDWLLTLDADDTFHGMIERAELDDVDVVQAEYRYANLHYWVTRLVRSGQGWRWHGRAHEYLVAPAGPGRSRRTGAFWVKHHADGGSRADKFEREVRLLLQDWAELPDDPRTAFYLARSYDDRGAVAQAVTWYRRRLMLWGWDEESFYARFRLGLALLQTGHSAEGCGELWRAWGERPWRAEPLVALAEHYRMEGLWHLAWEACELGFAHAGAQPDGEITRPPDALFVDAAATEWRVAYEASIAAWYVGQAERGRRLVDFLLGRPDLPGELRQAVEANRHFYDPGQAARPEV